MKLCRHCGAPLKREDAKFCTKCGREALPAEPGDNVLELPFTTDYDDPGGLAGPAGETLGGAASEFPAGPPARNSAPWEPEVSPPAGTHGGQPLPGPDAAPEPDPMGSDGTQAEPYNPFPADEDEQPFPADPHEEGVSFETVPLFAGPGDDSDAPAPPSAKEEFRVTLPEDLWPDAPDGEDLAKTLDFPFPVTQGGVSGTATSAPAPAEPSAPPPARPNPQAAPRPVPGAPASPGPGRPAVPPARPADPQNAPAQPARQTPPPASMRLRRGGARPAGRRKMVFIVAAALLVVLLAGGYFGVSYRYRAGAGTLIDEFVDALASGSAESVRGVVQGSGGSLPAGSLDPLLRAGADDATRAQIRAMLEEQLAGVSGGEPAIELATRPALLIFRRYAINILPATVEVDLAAAHADALSFSLDGAEVSAQEIDGALCLTGVAPGLHELQSFYNAYGVTLGSEVGELAVLRRQAAYTPAFDAVNATIRCEYPDAVILINGYTTELVAENGAVNIYPAAPGMEVTAQVHGDGRIDTAKVRIVRGTSDYRFEFEQSAGEVDLTTVPPEQLDVAYTLRNYFFSYLDAINAQDPDVLRDCTDEQRESAGERATGDANAGYLFEFDALWLDMGTFEFFADGGVQSARVLVSLRYRYADRETGERWQDGGNVQWCTLVSDGSGWLVSRTAIDNNQELSQNRLTLG